MDYKVIGLILLLFSGLLSAKENQPSVIKSKFGTEVIFAQPVPEGRYVSSDAYLKVYFRQQHKKADISWWWYDDKEQPNSVANVVSGNGHYYLFDNRPDAFSPSGRYLFLTLVNGSTVFYLDENKAVYQSRPSCVVLDLSNGCVTEADCTDIWDDVEDNLRSAKDELVEISPPDHTELELEDQWDKYYSPRKLANLLRCDAPSAKNINFYSQLSHKKVQRRANQTVLQSAIREFSQALPSRVVKAKTFLYQQADANQVTSQYLIAGDKVKLVQLSEDQQWAQIIYLNKHNKPIVAWLPTAQLQPITVTKPAKVEANFSGQWQREKSSYASFTLQLQQQANQLVGNYCFISNHGNRIDCYDFDEHNQVINNLTGMVKQKRAYLQLADGAKAEAVLDPSGNKLILTITDDKPFVDFNMSMPEKLILHKQ